MVSDNNDVRTLGQASVVKPLKQTLQKEILKKETAARKQNRKSVDKGGGGGRGGEAGSGICREFLTWPII